MTKQTYTRKEVIELLLTMAHRYAGYDMHDEAPATSVHTCDQDLDDPYYIPNWLDSQMLNIKK